MGPEPLALLCRKVIFRESKSNEYSSVALGRKEIQPL
jgi:hypothetical protein